MPSELPAKAVAGPGPGAAAAARQPRTLMRLVKGLVSLAFFAVLFAVVRRGEFASLLGRIDPLYFALSFAVAAAQISVSCWKWKILLDVYGRKASFGFLLRAYLIGYYFSNLLPSNVGGDVVRSGYAGRRIGSQTQAAIGVFMERFTGMLLMLALVVVAPLLRGGYGHPALWIPAAAAAGLLIGLGWIATLRIPVSAALHWPLQLVLRLRGTREDGARRRLLGGLEALALKLVARAELIHGNLRAAATGVLGRPRTLAAVTLLTVLYYAITWLNVYWSFRAFGAAPRFLDIVALLPTAMLAGSLPVTLGNLGIAEGAYVYYFSRFAGMAPEATLAMGLLLRLKLLAVGGLGFVQFLTLRAAPEPGDGPA